MKVDFEKALNPAQLEAVTTTEGPVLVIAGAGSGKTRTIVYRLAYLAEQGVSPASILLLTFTRKAAQEMLARAEAILGYSLSGTSGGTFHSFAYRILRLHAAEIGFEEGFTVMDRGDAGMLMTEAKENLGLGKGDRSFPKRDTLIELISKARNKELSLPEAIQADSIHLMAYAGDIEALAGEYARLKKAHRLLDYDDLLFTLERLIRDNPGVREKLRQRYRYVMVDEYQDTNLVQARLVKLLAGEAGNVMAVGDDAQSIYAFRGADVANILGFPKDFPDAKVVRLERNYRSTQPILDLTNAVLAGALEKYDKRLYTERADGPLPELYRTLSDSGQARVVLDKVAELSRKYAPGEIAVLFRAGYQSFPLEVLLNKLRIPFQKYGGIRFTEAAHIKDVLAYLRLAGNPADLTSWQRVLGLIKGIGKKTASKLHRAVLDHDKQGRAALAKAVKRYAELGDTLRLLDSLRSEAITPGAAMERVMAHYGPLLAQNYPDDYPRRQQGIEQLATIADQYNDIELFLADVSLENPEEEAEGYREEALTLSTIHSAKGLEFNAVLVIDLVEERFPTRRSLTSPGDLEEERRLMYVACTRARDFLALFVPQTIYLRHAKRTEPARPSPFVAELPPSVYKEFQESYAGGIAQVARPATGNGGTPGPFARDARPQAGNPDKAPMKLGFCRHKIFGRGKIIQFIPPDKCRVNFMDFGLKVINSQYLEMEED